MVCYLIGVHHIHYNKDYNFIVYSEVRIFGVRHIHYNKDYNNIHLPISLDEVYTISIITRISERKTDFSIFQRGIVIKCKFCNKLNNRL